VDHAKVAAALRRQHFYFFLGAVFRHLHDKKMPNDDYLKALAFALQSTHQQDRGRLLVTIPPRHLKSIAAAVALPAWALGQNPGCKILVATYGDELSREHASHFASVMRSRWYQSLFPKTKIWNSNQSELKTTRGGSRRSVSSGGAATGFGADLIVVDDLLKAQDASSQAMREKVHVTFTETLLSRFNDPAKGSLISIQQRLHEDDLPARLIETGVYDHLNLPAIAEENTSFPLDFGKTWDRQAGDLLDPIRMNKATLDQLRSDLGARTFSAQYQQDPVAPEGALIHPEELHLTKEFPDPIDCDLCVQSWDTASKADPSNDYSVCTTWGHNEGAWYLLDLYRGRLEFPKLKEKILFLREHWSAEKVLIEDSSSGLSILQQLRTEKRREGIVAIQPQGSKAERLEAQLDMLYDGRVRFDPSRSFWRELLNEMRAFPDGRHDDQIDSISQFLKWIRGRRGRSFVSTQGEGGSLRDEFGRYPAFHGTR
jgi:predicted phage terminase large subunit-like protein